MSATPGFDDLKSAWDWQPIEGCPGRFILQNADASLPVSALAGHDVYVDEQTVEGVKDKVLVVVLDGGGLISYARDDGSYLHTLNTPAGFDRKLRQLKIRRDLDDYL